MTLLRFQLRCIVAAAATASDNEVVDQTAASGTKRPLKSEGSEAESGTQEAQQQSAAPAPAGDCCTAGDGSLLDLRGATILLRVAVVLKALVSV